jgi:polar amino acid transport system substrate-binding protein
MNKFNTLTFFFLIYNLSIFSQEDESTLFKIIKKKKINISVAASYEPYYIYNHKDGFPGFEVEIAEKYAEFLGVEIADLKLANNFPEHLEFLKNGSVDICLGNSINRDRLKKVYFSDPYISVSPAALVNKSILPPDEEGSIVLNKNFRNILDLKNISRISMGVKRKTSNVDFLEEHFGKDKVVLYDTDILAAQALKDNKINCYVADNLYIEGLLQKDSSLKARFLPLLGSVVDKQLSIAFKKYDIHLQNNINLFIREMKRSGEMARLKERYFNSNKWVKEIEN